MTPEEIHAQKLESDSIVASCNCMTKSPDIQYHKPGCKYRLISERDAALREIQRLNLVVMMMDASAELAESHSREVKLREALTFYAEGNHIGSECSSGDGSSWIEGGEDGALARRVLSELPAPNP